MPGAVLRAIIGFVFAFHGVGHAMGIIPALGIVNVKRARQGWLKNWSSYSWLLTNLLGDTVSRILCVILYGAALLGFLGTALALLGWGGPHEWWRTLAVDRGLFTKRLSVEAQAGRQGAAMPYARRDGWNRDDEPTCA